MNAKEINRKALTFLNKQNFEKAQELFFYNAKKNPSHSTYNNLGFYLITEGLYCKNGSFRNALKLGIKYLEKSAKIKMTTTNSGAIIKAIDYLLRSEKGNISKYHLRAYNIAEQVLKLEPSYFMQYNLLRFWFLLDPKNEILLSRARDLFKEFPNRESLLLYLEIVCTNNLVVNGKEIVLAHGDFLDEAERLMYYAKFSMYENGYTLCKSVMDTYCIDEFIAAAIIECCVNTGHIKNAISYTEKIKSTEDSEALFEKVFENLEVSTECRKNIIDVYSSIIPPIELCCYFGCESHNIDWID